MRAMKAEKLSERLHRGNKRRGTKRPVLVTAGPECAEIAGLVYVTDSFPGIRRRRAGRGFSYTGPDGVRVTGRDDLKRIKSLGIPPAWTDIWISVRPDSHLQATGKDARGRKQYIYHPQWRKIREENKFNRMVAFGMALPGLRERTDEDLKLRGLARNKVLATVVQLLETTLIRIGNKEYARDNNSFGLTTLSNDHLDVSGSLMRFSFRGKSGKEHTIEIRDKRLARIVKRCRDIPGQELFQYVDDDGQSRTIDSSDVNEYIREITGSDFTAKDFRTWGGTVHAALALRDIGPFDSQTEARRNIVQAVKTVAGHLGNRPAICRKYYIHPAVLEAYLDGGLIESLDTPVSGEDKRLQPEERAVLALLRRYDEGRS
ncbi:MAG: DNA topoisomerase IB [Acidobacteriota bacterium]